MRATAGQRGQARVELWIEADDALTQATAAAVAYVGRALRQGYRPGRGDVYVLDHLGAVEPGA